MANRGANGGANGGPARAVLIEGPPGCGKSSLALALIDRGARLVGDDGVRLAPLDMPGVETRLIASPPPNIAGLLEVRNVGLVRFPTASAPVSLIIVLDPAAPRFVEQAEQAERFGCVIPLIRLWPDSPVLPLRAEQALWLHGIT
ncbi:serine kinase [Altererythrobacter xixiisoli]|uniref:Serine kinase n=2 Tax=Croceibacterium xixiisoli TaxID=1476466 RepID=A0A6I4TVT0_9SPHN|nr:serine kinase [Croceibacterium xixiisoli]MXO99360.1 serine kinase [Croceibacterium xixiisoli]